MVLDDWLATIISFYDEFLTEVRELEKVDIIIRISIFTRQRNFPYIFTFTRSVLYAFGTVGVLSSVL